MGILLQRDASHRSCSQSRRSFIETMAAGVGMLLVGRALQAAVTTASSTHLPIQNRTPLAPQPYMLLPLGSIKPAGWLRRQLEIQAGGLSGHLDEVWSDVGPNSGWLGGTGELWERGPYFVDGLVPLAWLLDSELLKSKAFKFIDWTLSNASHEGMIGPRVSNDLSRVDPWWPRIPMLKALTQYFEVTADPRVISVMSNYFRYQLRELRNRPLAEWGRFRWQDEVLSVIWLYNRTGEEQLLELARVLYSQGWDWGVEFQDFRFKSGMTVRDTYLLSREDRLSSHGVDLAMGLKALPVWSLMSASESDRTAIFRQLAILDRYHGLPTGLWSGDEVVGGRDPSRGTETCSVVETLFSLEQSLAITGNTCLADRIERIALNALPAALTEDMWARQYFQEPNQIECSLSRGPWADYTVDGNLFGLEPCFGCCTANFGQGWPKFAATLWMASSEGGLAAMMYSPCEVDTLVRGVRVRLREITEYPFRDRIHITVEPEHPLRFPLKLRVPGWTSELRVTVNGRVMRNTAENGFVAIERTWRSGDRIDIAFDFETRAVGGANGSVSVEHGPLLFSLPIGERWVRLREHRLKSVDWETYPTGVWNYGIVEGTRLQRRDRDIPSVPFCREEPAVAVTAEVRAIPQWTKEANTNFAPLPAASSVALSSGVSESVELIPYGAAKLRITSFPTIKTY